VWIDTHWVAVQTNHLEASMLWFDSRLSLEGGVVGHGVQPPPIGAFSQYSALVSGEL
jgi:hypothetical protein